MDVNSTHTEGEKIPSRIEKLKQRDRIIKALNESAISRRRQRAISEYNRSVRDRKNKELVEKIFVRMEPGTGPKQKELFT